MMQNNYRAAFFYSYFTFARRLRTQARENKKKKAADKIIKVKKKK
jgi:hypothetical protein